MKTATARASRVKTKTSKEQQFFKDLSVAKDVTSKKDVTTTISDSLPSRSKLTYKVQTISANDARRKFKMLVGINRSTDSNHVNKLIGSVRVMGVIRPVIVTKFTFKGDTALYILDGQNLFQALCKLNMDIPYIEVPVADNRDIVQKIALMNNSSRSWGITDYVNAWSSVNPDYIKLLKYYESSTLELTQVACILKGFNGWSGRIRKHIRLGEFHVQDETKAKSMLSYMEEVFSNLPVLDNKIKRIFHTSYMTYLCNNFTSYNHRRFMKYLYNNKRILSQANSDKSKIELFFKNA